jgi:hypothetical protein
MGAAMSNATVSNCMQKSSMVSVYSSETGKYIEDTYYSYYNGKDYSYYEKSWVSNRMSNYLDYNSFGVWYEKSPYTKYDYRFSTECSQYRNSY